ncbi:hypothetical protein SAMN04489764_3756 [Thermostaphylospora chromogena]|uniref:Uncharacterized protein n=1 Tax=Thermostaphylospora chromogena TaxID=35622 RepID=A0A1H1GRM8_9ACTN|nr:hypothetical protein SAMN04489764_3756 [Thermostaphylospora chromogena]
MVVLMSGGMRGVWSSRCVASVDATGLDEACVPYRVRPWAPVAGRLEEALMIDLSGPPERLQ